MAASWREPREDLGPVGFRRRKEMRLGTYREVGPGGGSTKREVLIFAATGSRAPAAWEQRGDMLTGVIREN